CKGAGEIEIVVISDLRLNVAARIKAPALRLYLRNRCNFTQTWNIHITRSWKQLLHLCLATFHRLRLFAPIEPDDVGEELDLFGAEIAVRPVDLAEGSPCIDEQDGVFALSGFAFVEEP